MRTAIDRGLDLDRSAQRAPSFEERARAHRGALRACAQRVLGDDAEADAVVEEVLAFAPRALALFRPAGNLGTWLQGLTVGAALARRAPVAESPEQDGAPTSRSERRLGRTGAAGV